MIITAWREVRKQREVDLILAGRKRDDYPEIEPEPGLQIMGATPDELLPELFSGCIAFVYPSFYEGFGLPVLEAMQCGAPVITSQDAAIIETADASAIHLDAHDPLPWVEAMLGLADNPDRRRALCEKGLARAAQFSWDRTARLTYEVYLEARKRFAG